MIGRDSRTDVVDRANSSLNDKKKESVLNCMEVPGKYETAPLIIRNNKFYHRVNLSISCDS